jgi:outer membrane protein assembly factor BamB
MNYDGSSEAENLVGFKIPWEKAVILAVDKKTGQEVWRGARGLSRLGHVTSNFLRVHGKDQMVSAAGDVIQGFDPTTGARIWSVYAKGEGVVPSVVVGDGLVYTSSGFEETTLRAVRPDGQGDVTKTHVAWSSTKGVSHIPSFLYRKPYLFMINETGIAVCLEAQTGKILWQSRVGGNHSASPIWSDGLIYFHSDEGETTIIKAAGEYEEVARNDLGELSQASFAVSNGQIFIRTEKNLYCIGD